MNIEHSKHIPISEILGKLNILPENPGKNELQFFSPWRNEKTPSFFVNVKQNLWFDHGEGVGGDLLRFVQIYLERQNQDCTASDALRWLSNMAGAIPEVAVFPRAKERHFEREDSPLTLKSNRSLENLGLIRYLEKRGIPLELGKRYFRELRVHNRNTGKRFIALGFENEERGFELRNPLFKACLRPKAITFIRGKTAKPDAVHVFEAGFDYLSVITMLNGKPLKGDTIILHSVALLKQAMAYIHKYGYRTAYTWMDNDPAGEKATSALAEFFKAEECLAHIPMNSLYAAHKDVNAWHMHQLRLE
jgi:hypothetical protein